MTEEPLKPQSLSPESRQPEKNSSANRIWVPAVVLLVVGLGLVGFLSRRQDPPTPPSASTPTPEPSPRPTEDPALRLAAEQALEELLAVMSRLEEMAPDLWGGAIWKEVEQTSTAGDAALSEQRWKEAERQYRTALDSARRLQEQLPEIPGRVMPQAERAYAAGKRAEAVGLLRAVLKIDPEHPEALDLLPRAEVADRSFALLQQARSYLQEEEPDLAFAELLRLDKLDAAFPGAAELRKDVEDALAESEIRTVIGRGFAALDAGDLVTAGAAAEEAFRLSPRRSSVLDLKRQVDAALQEQAILNKRKQAERLASEEKWAQAYNVWLEIEALDPDTPWVREGLAEALRWAVIEEKLKKGLANPGGKQAGIWVQEFAEREGWPPGLDAKAERLTSEWQAWNTPVKVTLVSDGETEVLIPGKGRWRNIIRQDIQLLPGSYVAKGGRLGYRDVRVEFKVPPGEQTQTVKVVCTEGI